MTTPDAPPQTPAAGRGAWTLATQFAVAGGLVLFVATLFTGLWVSERIEETVVRNTAVSATHYMDSFVQPLSQELAENAIMSEESRARLDGLFENTPLGERVLSYKIWKERGLIAAASDHELVGTRLPPSDNLRRAWRGEVIAEFEGLEEEENVAEQELGVPLLEIYTPLHEEYTGRVIAVAEFYEANPQLADDLASARLRSWIAVAGLMLALGSVLYVIVQRGSFVIERQRAALNERLNELSEMSEANRALRMRVQNAAGRAAAMNETALRRIGAELEEAPARRLSDAAERLDALEASSGQEAREDVEALRHAVGEAMGDIRDVARGLSLPDIEGRPAEDIVNQAIDAHSARTGDLVRRVIDTENGGNEPSLTPAAAICLHRFVQEGLANAHAHGGGRDLRVRVTVKDGELDARVSDRGPGFQGAQDDGAPRRGFGLSGLRDRVESLGGHFATADRDNGGAEIAMTLRFVGA